MLHFKCRVRHVSTHRNCRSQNTEKNIKCRRNLPDSPTRIAVTPGKKEKHPNAHTNYTHTHTHTHWNVALSCAGRHHKLFKYIFRSGDSGRRWSMGCGRWAVGGGWCQCGGRRSAEKRKQKASPQLDGRNGTREWHTCRSIIE